VKDRNRLLLPLVVAAYMTLGGLYAVYTPPWQVPDEPAHYNYIRAIVESGALPVMEVGDYDQAYLERLTAERFPPDLPIEPLTYEDHQPPLYYLLAAPIYCLFNGALLPLRLFSVALGAGGLICAWATARTLFPRRPSLALTTVVLVAFLPQRLAMAAGVNNDALAEVMVGASLWMAVRCVRGRIHGWRAFLGWGLLLGLTVLTKTTAYVALPVAVLAVGLWAWRGRREGIVQRGLRVRPLGPGGRGRVGGDEGRDERRGSDHRGGSPLRAMMIALGWMLPAAALVAGPWLARNVTLYGWNDPLGLMRHNAVVVGQPRTAEWAARYGWAGLAARFLRTTFQSFWGQFGWMGVPLHPPIYAALAIFSALLAAGFLAWLFDQGRPRLTEGQRAGTWVLALSALLTGALYLAYNRTFVQHQGRYLFPALVPLALAGALGLDWLLSPRAAWRTAVVLGGLGSGLVVWGLWRGDVPLTPAVAAMGLAALFGLASVLRRGRALVQGTLALALGILDLYALFGAIVPALSK